MGRTVAGRFQIRDIIARGGMGKVYLAEQAPLGRTCAVKVLSPKYEGDEDPEFQKRFFLEASTASKLTHPNTVTIFDYGRDGDIYYIAMEYVRGRTLFRMIRDEGPVAESRVARIMQQVARSLREAHTLGVIHRDMKPANVVLVEGGDEPDRVKVLDFGLVKDFTGDDTEDLTQQGLFMGSPKYMAPEQILGNEVSPATDVYSLGVVAYELLTGQVPFDRGTSVKTLMAHVNDVPPPIARANPEVLVSREMQSIITRCLAKSTAERYRDMDALLSDLISVEGGEHLTESLRNVQAVHPHTVSGARPKVRRDTEAESPTRPLAALPAAFTEDKLRRPAAVSRAQGLAFMLGLGVLAIAGAGAVWMVSDSNERTAEAPMPASPVLSSPALSSPASVPPEKPTEIVATPRQVLVHSKPAGASVHDGARSLCKETPCNVSFSGAEAAATHELVIRKAGYRDAEVVLRVDQSKVTVELRAIAPAATSGRRPVRRVPSASPTPKPKGLSGYKDSPY